LKGLAEVRSVSKFGLSQVVAIFEDDVDIYFARQQVNERLGELRLAAGIDKPIMGPVATGLGEVYHYFLSSPTLDLTELRTLHDWVVRPRLRRVPGVAEVNTLGGLAKQYEARVDPDKLAKYKLTLDDVTTALKENNANVGGGPVERAGEVHLVQGIGLVRSVEEIAAIPISAIDGVPIRVRDVAEVGLGHTIRRGGTTADGRGEVVLGLAFMRMGENSRDVTMALEEAMKDVRRLLPKEAEITVVYRRTDLVNHVLGTVEKNLFEGAVLVIAILFAFLGNIRAGLIVASVIPLSMLFAVTMMQKVGITGSLMSLGAIDFGLVVDSSVVMVENCVHHLAHQERDKTKLQIVEDAAVEVRKPTLFGELIIMIVYLPILTLQGTEGKLFRPMALTVVFALAASMLLSLTLMPVLASFGLLRGDKDKITLVDRFFLWIYRPLLGRAMRHPILTLGGVGALTVATSLLGFTLGSEFIPKLSEGTLVFNTIRLASVSLDESQRYGSKIEQVVMKAFPDEVEHVWTRTGTAEVATDPMGLELSDVFVSLKPREAWKAAKTQDELVEKLRVVVGTLPGMATIYSQPIEQRINEMIAGIKADLGVKLFGDDLEVLKTQAAKIEEVLKSVRGAEDVSVEQITGLPVLKVEIDRPQASRYGVPARRILDAIEAVGGLPVGEIREGERRFPLVVRLPTRDRDDPDSLKKILITTSDGRRLPITDLATFGAAEGPSTIQREWGKRRIIIQANVRGRDVGSFVEEAQAKIARSITPQLPTGYTIAWGGQFENKVRAEKRLWLVVPLALALTLSLLYLTFQSLRDALMIFSGVLFARVGGVFGLWVTGQPFTISAGVGFVALAGASMLAGLVLVNAIRDRMAHGLKKREAIEAASMARLRPVLMTGAVAALGFVPMMLSTGIGAEVQRPLATVVVFGMACDTLLTMLALPALYVLFGKELRPSEATALVTADGEARSEVDEKAPAITA
jgi:heavy metal efflux system protein